MTQLKIFEIFYSLQGESSRVGLPTIFIRLSGCPMRCHYCDTAYAFQGGTMMGIEDIMASIKKYDTHYVTVTGGEPLAQKEVIHLLKTLADSNYEVSIETGGGLVFAKDEIDLTKPLLTVNGDVLWQENASDLELLCNAWDPLECDILLGLKRSEDYLGYDGVGDFEIIQDRLFRLPDLAMNYAFVGLQIINPKILKQAPKDLPGDLPRKCFSMSHFYRSAVGEGGLVHRIKAVELAGKYFHIGNVDAVKFTEKNF